MIAGLLSRDPFRILGGVPFTIWCVPILRYVLSDAPQHLSFARDGTRIGFVDSFQMRGIRVGVMGVGRIRQNRRRVPRLHSATSAGADQTAVPPAWTTAEPGRRSFFHTGMVPEKWP